MLTRQGVIEVTGQDPVEIFGSHWKDVVEEASEIENCQPDWERKRK